MMLYAFGDVPVPRPDTVSLLEDMVTTYIADLTVQAYRVSRKRGKIRTEDLMYILRKDHKKYARMEELLYMNDELKKARKVFEADEMDAENGSSTPSARESAL